MDTWATSSLTPQIAGKWEEDPALFAKVFPMDLRPQAHEIIRTWLFSTIVRSELEHSVLPWRHAAISGWILDPDRKKIGKSLGNAITPLEYLEKYSTDAVRYWAGSARLGADTVFSEEQMKVGRRLAIKILNASRFVLSRVDGSESADQVPPTGSHARSTPAMLARLAAVVDEATAEFDSYDHARALEVTESFFWSYCDDYLELVKTRAYGDAVRGRPGFGTPRAGAELVGDLAPFRARSSPTAPKKHGRGGSPGSIHRASWPSGSVAGGAGRPRARARAPRGRRGSPRRCSGGPRPRQRARCARRSPAAS